MTARAQLVAPWWRRALAWRRPLARAVVYFAVAYTLALFWYSVGKAIRRGYQRMVLASERVAVEDCRTSSPPSIACDLAVLIHDLEERQ